MPAPEVILWTYIRNKQLGVKFRRQQTVGNRILDFYAPSLKLGIEIEGESHFVIEHQYANEREKDRLIYQLHGIEIIRVLNSDVMKNLAGVLTEITQTIKRLDRTSEPEAIPHLTSPFRKGGGNQTAPSPSINFITLHP